MRILRDLSCRSIIGGGTSSLNLQKGDNLVHGRRGDIVRKVRRGIKKEGGGRSYLRTTPSFKKDASRPDLTYKKRREDMA